MTNFTPLPGSFPPDEQTTSLDESSPVNTFGKKIMKVILYIPLTILFYILNTLLTLAGVLKPFGKLLHFYAKKDRHFNEDLSTQFINIVDMLSSTNITSESSGNSFETLYNLENGVLSKNMIKGGYTDVLKSCSQDGKFAIIYFYDPMLYDPLEYVKKILVSDGFVQAVKKYNCIVWFCDVTTPQGYQTANSLKVRQFPFLGALGSHTDSKMILVARIEGKLFDYEFSQFEAKLSMYYPKLLEIRRRRQYQELQRLLTEQQDSRFQESLRRDQERDLERQRAAQETELKQQWLLWRMSVLKEEPESNYCRVSIKVGEQRIIRKFDASLRIEEIYAFVALERAGLLHDTNTPGVTVQKPDYDYQYDFQLFTPVPRKLLDQNTVINEEDTIFPSGTILVESV